MTTTYLIQGYSYPLGTDDLYDYLAQYGLVTQWETEAKTLALYYLPPTWDRDMPSCFAPLLLTIFQAGPAKGAIHLHWEEPAPNNTGTYHRGKAFLDLADAVAHYLALKENLYP